MTKNPTDDTVTDHAQISTQYGYVTENNVTTNLVSSLNNTVSGTQGTKTVNYSYTYDGRGKITGIISTSNITGMSGSTQYIYDESGQLIKEINGTDYTEYTYDSKGNISTRKAYSNNTLVSTDNFTYGAENWEDRLTGYNGKTIAYDSIGNPTTYLGATLTWRGRQLMSLTDNVNSNTISYLYGADGLRRSKTVNGVKTQYYYVGDSLAYQICEDGTELYFFYDSRGALSVIRYLKGDKDYHFYVATNMQGDVVGIYTAAGVLKVSYEYDAWGNCKISSDTSGIDLGNVNPIRYRGYYYDTETGFYYLQSRYYCPKIGRFLNADGYVTTNAVEPLAYNMYAYCCNNPVDYSDGSGKYRERTANESADSLFGIFVTFIVAGIVYLAASTATATTYYMPSISTPKEKVKEKTKVIPAPPPTPTVIYRHGGTNPGNLTPKKKDIYTGLSFSTVPAPGAAKTTIEELNATGVVVAVRDGPKHVSVKPVGASVEDWINAGPTSIWTQTVKAVVVKWDGVY